MPAEEQVCVLYAGVRGHLDKMATSEIPKFEPLLLDYIKSNHAKVLDDIRKYFYQIQLIIINLFFWLEIELDNFPRKLRLNSNQSSRHSFQLLDSK